MPYSARDRTTYIRGGDPDGINESTLYKPGELGNCFSAAGGRRAYQLVQADSGATADITSGVIAANDLAFWKDKTNFLVTNDIRQAESVTSVTGINAGRNQVAGVFRGTVTAGNYTAVCQTGENIDVPDGGNTFAAGETVIAEGAAVSAADRIAVGTATTYQKLGVARGAASGGVVAIDLHINSIE